VEFEPLGHGKKTPDAENLAGHIKKALGKSSPAKG
jgi:hypothetical protein